MVISKQWHFVSFPRNNCFESKLMYCCCSQHLCCITFRKWSLCLDLMRTNTFLYLWWWLWPCRTHCRRRWWPCRDNRQHRVWRRDWSPGRPSHLRSWSWCCPQRSGPSCPSSTGSSEEEIRRRDIWDSASRLRPQSPVWAGRQTPEASWLLQRRYSMINLLQLSLLDWCDWTVHYSVCIYI